MKKVNVLFFIYELGAGGAARTLLNIINHLDRTRFNPILVTLNFDGAYEQDLASDVKMIKLNTQRLRKAVFPLAKVIRKENIDLVFSTQFPDLNVIAILGNFFSFTRAKSIVREADHFGGGFRTNAKLLITGLFYKYARQVISLSEGVKENLVRRYKVKADNIKVIHNPVDIENIQEKMNEDIEAEHKNIFATEEPVIITAGRLVEQKDQQTLLRAFAKVNQQLKSRLLILGEGPLLESLQQQAEDLNVKERVYFIGFQDNPYRYFQRADLFVLSSKHEGFSHVIAEALASGTLVVSTDCHSGPAEVLNEGEFGTLCEVGNETQMASQIVEVLTLSDQQRVDSVQKGYKRAHDFKAEHIVQQYEQTFMDALGSG
ncbi:glycosyltransferase [Natribacillus halophilus]|uniref:Glycosyltransferase involved in cell wall bisynthesis n=1 Tax=Natribacillus halophilus TaxID=549003 RepID=A0A1G8SAY0_9BACI|nr:glycosyltransferase [Natribacillus halophilus]SDJ25925.1 Glycosyltransferase involved in cell wall bisynthesis [Natribacillus halophilus]